MFEGWWNLRGSGARLPILEKEEKKQAVDAFIKFTLHTFYSQIKYIFKIFFFFPKPCYILLKIKVISIYMKLKNGLKYVQMATYIWEHMRRQHKIGGKLSIEKGKVMSKTWNIHEDISTRVRKIINERRILNLYFGRLVDGF